MALSAAWSAGLKGRLPGPQGYYFLTAEPGLGPKGPRVRPRLSAGPGILSGDDGLL